MGRYAFRPRQRHLAAWIAGAQVVEDPAGGLVICGPFSFPDSQVVAHAPETLTPRCPAEDSPGDHLPVLDRETARAAI